MKIVMINGSPRKQGATAQIIKMMAKRLNSYQDVDVHVVHVADLQLTKCMGCGKCYEQGSCILKDDIEALSVEIEQADGILIGSPTYASNVSGQIKVIIDRGHFVIEQLLHNKQAISVVTYENYGGKDTQKVLQKLFLYSGANITQTVLVKLPFTTSSNCISDQWLPTFHKTADTFYKNILYHHRSLWQLIKHRIIFTFGIYPFVMKKGIAYQGVIKRWQKAGILKAHSKHDSST